MLYSIDEKTNIFDAWLPLVSDIEGSNYLQNVPLSATNSAGYYRFRVKLAP